MTLLTFLFLFSAAPAELLNGTIIDNSGAVVAGAHIELSGQVISFNASSDDAGHFVVQNVPNGTYTLKVTAAGFRPHVSAVSIPSDALSIPLLVATRSDEILV